MMVRLLLFYRQCFEIVGDERRSEPRDFLARQRLARSKAVQIDDHQPRLEPLAR